MPQVSEKRMEIVQLTGEQNEMLKKQNEMLRDQLSLYKGLYETALSDNNRLKAEAARDIVISKLKLKR